MVTLERVVTWRTVSTWETEISAVMEIVVTILVVETQNPILILWEMGTLTIPEVLLMVILYFP